MTVSNISITLYANPGCPYVHRATTTLNELKIPFKSVFIDLDTPRPASYLEINPRGTVPALTFNSSEYGDGKEVVINESLVIIYFLADLIPNNHLLPATGTIAGAAERADIFFFIDTWGNKIGSLLGRALLLAAGESQEKAAEHVDEVVKAVEKEIEPLLAREEGSGLFLGGKERITLAEIVVAPFLLRNFAWAEAGVIPLSLKTKLLALPNFGKWATEVIKNESLLKDWDEATFVEKSKIKLQEFKAGTFKPKV
ncbi:hypothetical protein ABW20_dc0109418 [Dactylellina cionopaga]|nr:hypothetical protein ABW20_dc0109418 [Dactylellina cionopaga]